jgi:hypothetical protein
MYDVPPDMFVPNQTLELQAEPFNHCSSICPYGDGVLITWYSGKAECVDDQSVYLLFISKSGTSKPLQLGSKTGNPVLWRDKDQHYLLWSHFEDDGDIKHPADRWKFCSLWLTTITVQDEILMVGDMAHIKGRHLLGRCRPVAHRGQLFLPLYDEVHRKGVIFIGSGENFRQVGSIGQDMIQPTLWVDNNKLCSLSRTFQSSCRYSPYSESVDGGRTWTTAAPTNIKNYNSSLHALTWHGHHLLLWNDTDKIQRRDLSLGVLVVGTGGPVVQKLFRIDNGSYPTLCENVEGDLCMSFTTSRGMIRYHAWDKRKLLDAIAELGGRGNPAGPRGDPGPGNAIAQENTRFL